MNTGTDSADHLDVAAPADKGLLVWGVKDEFRRYVASLHDGVCDVSADVRLPGGGQFGFPLVAMDHDEPAVLRFSGAVTFRGHADMLVVSIVDPWLEHDDGSWLLTCREPGSDSGRLRLAMGRQVDSGPVFKMSLASAGVGLFGGNYRLAEPMGDLLLYLPPRLGDLAYPICWPVPAPYQFAI